MGSRTHARVQGWAAEQSAVRLQRLVCPSKPPCPPARPPAAYGTGTLRAKAIAPPHLRSTTQAIFFALYYVSGASKMAGQGGNGGCQRPWIGRVDPAEPSNEARHHTCMPARALLHPFFLPPLVPQGVGPGISGLSGGIIYERMGMRCAHCAAGGRGAWRELVQAHRRHCQKACLRRRMRCWFAV